MDQIEAVRSLLGSLPVRTTSGTIGDGQIIKDLLIQSAETDFNVFQLRQIMKHFYFDEILKGAPHTSSNLINALLCCLPGDSNLTSTTDIAAWHAALSAASGLVAANLFLLSDARLEAVAASASNMLHRGYKISVEGNQFKYESGEMERATAALRDQLGLLGPFDTLGNIFTSVRAIYGFDYGMYLTARRYSTVNDKRSPTIPFAFLLNIAVQTSVPSHAPATPAKVWADALHLASDICATLNCEPYFNLSYQIGIGAKQIVETLREMAIYDHLFTFRQWRLGFTKEFISIFYGRELNSALYARLGWDLDDVVALCRATEHFATRDPNVVTLNAIKTAGVRADRLAKMMPFFFKSFNATNTGYNSPLHASDAYSLMFAPFVRHGPEHVLIPAASIIGPTFHEALMDALRPIIGSDAANTLVGEGTERVVRALLVKGGMNITHEAATYHLGGEGECDFVVEDDENILLIECKAKPLTRATMAGISGEALLDFAGGMFAAQKQALHHERLLRQHGRITFDDGSSLDWNGQKIYRLAITLLDQGALQDRMLFRSLYQALASSTVAAAPTFKKISQVNKLDKSLSELRDEIRAMDQMGVNIMQQTRNSASLSVGQLEAVLPLFSSDLTSFCKQLFVPMTYGALNPLAELHHYRNMIASAAASTGIATNL